jgi:hypothetical protein
LSKWTSIAASVSVALYEQAHQYANRLTDQPDQSLCAVIQSAVTKFITAKHPHLCPVKFTPTTKFAPRSTEIGGRLPIGIHEELRAYANKHGLTMGAVVRRAVYEYTKPEAPNTPDLVATIDAWADRAKFIKGL